MYAPLDAQQKSEKLEAYKKQMTNMNIKEKNILIEQLKIVLAFNED